MTKPDLVETVAQWLHDEYEDPIRSSRWTWPDRPNDDGFRGNGGYVYVVPKSVAEHHRYNAERLLSLLSTRAALPGLAPVSDLQAENARLKRRLDDALAALRSIAEGNLGDQPWQADYETIRQVATNALNAALTTTEKADG